MKQVELFSDGSSLGNPGAGGYGVILRFNGYQKELSKGFSNTTNNRMEIAGVIAGLSALKEPCEVTIVTDSQYVIKGMTQWIAGWKKNNWLNSGKQPVKNKDLWQELDAASACHKVKWIWVKGHNGHSENEQCDILARTAATGCCLGEDTGYNNP